MLMMCERHAWPSRPLTLLQHRGGALWWTFFLSSKNRKLLTYLLSSPLPSPSSAPRSSSVWRDSPMSFTMASVKLLAAQEGTNRCPCSFFHSASFPLLSCPSASWRLAPDLHFLLDHCFVYSLYFGVSHQSFIISALLFCPVAILFTILFSAFFCLQRLFHKSLCPCVFSFK